MVYESDFYTTRRPYRTSPSYSTYTVSSTPSRQVRLLPGLGKVHVVHTYDRIVPYIGHKKLTVVTVPPRINATRSSVLRRQYDWIENKVRPWVAYSPTNRYLNSDSAVRFVYMRNPISGLKYHSEYIPSRYYNFYRIIRPLPSYDDYWAYYRPLSLYSNYWPFYRYLSYIDDAPVSRSLKLQRKPASLTGLSYTSSYYPKWYNYYLYYRYYWPYSHSYDYSYWPSYNDYHYYYYPKNTSPFSIKYWPYWSYYRSLYYDPKRSYYWQKYLPISYSLSNYSSNYAKYLDSIFDDETRLIRAQTASLLKQIHIPVPRIRSWPITPLNRYGEFPSLPVKYSTDTYIHRLLTVSPNSKVEYATYYTEPVKKYIGQGHLSCVSYAGDKSYNRRRPLTMYEDAVKNDIQLLSYYINRFREEKKQPKEIQVPLSASRPSRIFNVQKPLEDPVVQELKDLKEARAARLAKIYDSEDKSSADVENSLKAKKKAEEARLAEERAIAEEQARQAAQAKKEEAARQAELARQEKLAAQAAAERAAEQARQEEIVRQAELERQRQEEEQKRLEEEERARQEEQRQLEEEKQKRLEEEENARQEELQRLAEEEARAEEERKALIRLEEIARQAEEEREAELARQAEELAELARQEELERAREQEEKAKREEELAELARQEAELAELERQEKELAEQELEATEEVEEIPAAAEEIAEPVAEEADEGGDESEAAIAADSEQPQDLTDEDIPDEE